ncbi:MAG: hypothetical protein Harvfovirus61_3 [Harvfovirus sp.]|uniref:F-box domain-containing protein n=1 Tax=Harvfovirus sp. TaxID=2487768 RepID=A0A3G5A3M5_9VIRU|nr:MAG: hypothetical protein Harvfovirus61_3 [Harvfovirus sp.]
MVLRLPLCLVELIFKWLDVNDVRQMAAVSVDVRSVCMSNPIWQSFVLARWSLFAATSERVIGHLSWLARYQELLRISRNWKTGNYHEIILSEHSGDINAVTCSNDLIISCSEDKTIRVWHIPTRKCLHILHHAGSISDIRIHNNELISSSRDGIIRIWSMKTGKEILCVRTTDHKMLEGWTADLRRIKCTSGRIFVGGWQGQILIWDRHTGAALYSLEVGSEQLQIEYLDAEGHYLAAAIANVVFIYDHTVLSEDFDIKKPKHTRTHPLLHQLNHIGVRCARMLSESSAQIVTIGAININVFSLISGQLLQSLRIHNDGFVSETIPNSPNLKIFEHFKLETPDDEAKSPDLKLVRVWRAFGKNLPESEAIKILVSNHNIKCSNNEVLVIVERNSLIIRDYVPFVRSPAPLPIVKRSGSCVIF